MIFKDSPSPASLGCGFNVPFFLLFREIDHVGREERFSVFLEILLVLIEHTIEPWQQFLGAMVCVQDDRNSVNGRKCSDIMCCGDGPGNRSTLIGVGDTLSSEVGGSSLR